MGTRVLVMLMVLALSGCGDSSPYDAERGKWKSMCGAMPDTPEPTIEDEFSGRSTPLTQQLFDRYLLSEPVEQFPSPVRNDLTMLRQAVQDRRSGALTADQARAAGIPGRNALVNQWRDGACSYFARQHS